MDVVGAYLQGDVEEEIYMRPRGCEGAFRVRKRCLAVAEVEVGADTDDCLHILQDENEGVKTVVFAYVDNMDLVSKTIAAINQFKRGLTR